MNYTARIYRERAEQVQQEIMSRGIHRALAGQHREPEADTIERLRKEYKRYV